ncbi:hypothetical protein QR680_017873 [Steinernema hermaphroditum]|uniref:Nuclear receptor domain-containing protein n=1 Tax=Steinernema hermaphroditum TaxID=289476 RepID=A0AA39HH33_9BILA|nr:hypothetical protein QR680_017873 [Steinernema hermaphroditum]
MAIFVPNRHNQLLICRCSTGNAVRANFEDITMFLSVRCSAVVAMLRLKHERYLLQKKLAEDPLPCEPSTSEEPPPPLPSPENSEPIDSPPPSEPSRSPLTSQPSTSNSSPSLSEPSTSRSSPSHSEAPTTCLVCGQSASCYYYGAPCCNSCKTFFRRAVHANKVQKCSKGGQCRIEHGLRLCRECRYQKCIQLGMKPEAVQLGSNSGSRTIVERRSLSQYDITQSDVLFTTKLKELVRVEHEIRYLRNSNYFPYAYQQTIQHVLAQPAAVGEIHKYQPVVEYPKRPIVAHHHIPFLLLQGYKSWTYVEALLAIEFYKALDVFQQLTPTDQYALVKGTITQLIFFSKSYDSFSRGYTDRVVYPDGNTPLQFFVTENEQSTQQPHFLKLFNTIKEGVVSDLAKARITGEQAAILKMIIALNPSAPNLSSDAQECITNERLIYIKALMSILQREPCSLEWLQRFQQLYDIVNRNLVCSTSLKQMVMCGYVSPDLFKLGNLIVELYL